MPTMPATEAHLRRLRSGGAPIDLAYLAKLANGRTREDDSAWLVAALPLSAAITEALRFAIQQRCLCWGCNETGSFYPICGCRLGGDNVCYTCRLRQVFCDSEREAGEISCEAGKERET
jgi:hypothetical protein